MSRIDYLRRRHAEAKAKAESARRAHRDRRAASRALRETAHALLRAEAAAKRQREKATRAWATAHDLFFTEEARP